MDINNQADDLDVVQKSLTVDADDLDLGDKSVTDEVTTEQTVGGEDVNTFLHFVTPEIVQFRGFEAWEQTSNPGVCDARKQTSSTGVCDAWDQTSSPGVCDAWDRTSSPDLYDAWSLVPERGSTPNVSDIEEEHDTPVCSWKRYLCWGSCLSNKVKPTGKKTKLLTRFRKFFSRRS